MTRDWWGGRLADSRGAALPVAAVVLMVVALVANPGGDIRTGVFPWLMAVATLLLALTCVRLVVVHQPQPPRSALVGGWWTAAAFGGIAGFFLAVALGEVLGIEEDSAGVLAYLPMISMAFGLLSMTPAVVLLALGARKADVIARQGVGALWVLAPLVPVLMIFGGLVDGSAETVGTTALLATFGGCWVVVGASPRQVDSRDKEAVSR